MSARKVGMLVVVLALCVSMGCARVAKRNTGRARAEHYRPRHFPHRIWAATDFEAQPHMYGWEGARERNNIPRYAGNATALRSEGNVRRNFSGKKFIVPWVKAVSVNPVPGPRMGKVNKLYVRYYLAGATKAQFQHYSLSVADNNNIRISGLVPGKWMEITMNFSRDARRNDGTPGVPFKNGERMDDLQVYLGRTDSGKTCQLIIDDMIFFADDPRLPPEPEPFPRRVMFLAAFDTGIDLKSRPKFYPGQFEPAVGGGPRGERFGIAGNAPKGAYWVVARPVPKKGTGDQHVFLEMKPPRPVGPNTRLRFRYWLEGADKIRIALHDATAKKDRAVVVNDCKQGRWVTQYVTFSKDEKFVGGGKFATGNKTDSVAFIVPAGKAVRLFVDEVVLFDAGSRPL